MHACRCLGACSCQPRWADRCEAWFLGERQRRIGPNKQQTLRREGSCTPSARWNRGPALGSYGQGRRRSPGSRSLCAPTATEKTQLRGTSKTMCLHAARPSATEAVHAPGQPGGDAHDLRLPRAAAMRQNVVRCAAALVRKIEHKCCYPPSPEMTLPPTEPMSIFKPRQAFGKGRGQESARATPRGPSDQYSYTSYDFGLEGPTHAEHITPPREQVSKIAHTHTHIAPQSGVETRQTSSSNALGHSQTLPLAVDNLWQLRLPNGPAHRQLRRQLRHRAPLSPGPPLGARSPG